MADSYTKSLCKYLVMMEKNALKSSMRENRTLGSVRGVGGNVGVYLTTILGFETTDNCFLPI